MTQPAADSQTFSSLSTGRQAEDRQAIVMSASSLELKRVLMDGVDNTAHSPVELNHNCNEKNGRTSDKLMVGENNTFVVNSIPNHYTKEEEAAATGGPDRTDDKETWGKKIDFLLSIIGFAVDLANVWRFPYFCYKNGGGAFLIPYFTMLICGALPLFFMELVLGQFHRQGAISVWKISPLFKGVGWAVCLISYYVAFYYNVIIAWSLYYLFMSFTSTLPWTTCNNEWNSELCTVDYAANATNGSLANTTRIGPAAEFFERGVLGAHLSEGVHDLGVPRWPLVLCLLGVFVILYLALWKGVKSSGKVVWVTATAPYVILLIFLIRGAFLPGALDGVLYFITPNLSRLQDPIVWFDAAQQIFYSVGAGFGVHIAYASYNKFSNNCYKDCLITAGINSFTSIFAGFVVFIYLGYMALKQNRTIEEVAQQGAGLVFIVYPEAIATLPGSVAWAIVFFVMLLTLGLDSAMGGMESVLTGLQDEYRSFFKNRRFSREIFTAVVIFIAFLSAIINVTNGGIYIFHMLDSFAAGTSIIFAVCMQSIAIGWFYGLEQFCDDIESMLGFRPNIYWRICWKFISPLFLITVVIASIVVYNPLSYYWTNSVYIYPNWANIIGWVIAASSMLMVPGVAIYKLLTTQGSLRDRIAINISPYWEHANIRQGEPVRRFQKRHWLYV